MPHLAENPHAELARLRKARALADALHAQNVPAHYIEDVEPGDRFWAKVAQEATRREGRKVNPPGSKATVDEVVAELRKREEQDFSDPFDFPGAPRNVPTVDLPGPDPGKLRDSVRRITEARP